MKFDCCSTKLFSLTLPLLLLQCETDAAVTRHRNRQKANGVEKRTVQHQKRLLKHRNEEHLEAEAYSQPYPTLGHGYYGASQGSRRGWPYANFNKGRERKSLVPIEEWGAFRGLQLHFSLGPILIIPGFSMGIDLYYPTIEPTPTPSINAYTPRPTVVVALEPTPVPSLIPTPRPSVRTHTPQPIVLTTPTQLPTSRPSINSNTTIVTTNPEPTLSPTPRPSIRAYVSQPPEFLPTVVPTQGPSSIPDRTNTPTDAITSSPTTLITTGSPTNPPTVSNQSDAALPAAMPESNTESPSSVTMVAPPIKIDETTSDEPNENSTEYPAWSPTIMTASPTGMMSTPVMVWSSASIPSLPSDAPTEERAPTFPPCNVCGEGKAITREDVRMLFPGQSAPISCMDIQRGGLHGYLDPMFCPMMPELISDACGCEQVSSETQEDVTYSPSAPPTRMAKLPTTPPATTISSFPTSSPTAIPTVSPTPSPTTAIGGFPASSPTAVPTAATSVLPTASPTTVFSDFPTSSPTAVDNALPTVSLTVAARGFPTLPPTTIPTILSSLSSTTSTSSFPTSITTKLPTAKPTTAISSLLTMWPTSAATAFPTTLPTVAISTLSTTQPAVGHVDLSSSPSTTPSETASLSPSFSLTGFIRQISFQAGIEIDLDFSLSYQSLALEWLVTNENIDVYSDVQIVQRYALACIFFATGWDDLRDDTEEQWTGVWSNSTDWVSDVDECSWYGVVCDSEYAVTDLDLSSNNLTAFFPPEVLLLNETLQLLDLTDNFFLTNEGDENAFLGFLGNLKYLYLGGTSFKYDGIPPGIDRLSHLVEFDCSHTLYDGPLRHETFANKSALKYLQLSGNRYDSTIPESIVTAPSLRYLYVQDGGLEGSFDFIPEMPMIRDLWLDYNPDLKGGIPTSIGQASSLISMSLAGTSLTGQLPTELGLLTSIRSLYLYQTEITGTIPSELGDLERLRIFQAEFTSLSGGMPAQVCSLRNESLVSLEMDCIGGMVCDCCTLCF